MKNKCIPFPVDTRRVPYKKTAATYGRINIIKGEKDEIYEEGSPVP